MCARLLAFSNGDLQALFDRSDGFYRRQLVLTTKEKPAGRVDDPDLAEKMKAEVEGILLWAFEGLQRLAANNFKFTESDRTRGNREAVKRDNNNVYDFLDSDGYVRLKADLSASSKELYEVYQIYCTENNLPALKPRSFSAVSYTHLDVYKRQGDLFQRIVDIRLCVFAGGDVPLAIFRCFQLIMIVPHPMGTGLFK